MKKLFLLPLVLLGCGSNATTPQSFAGLSRVSSLSPWAGCSTAGQGGTNYRSAEVEPFVAIDPTNPLHLVGVWQQDRWSNGGSNGLASGASFDGGKTWTQGFAHFTNCSGGNGTNRATFQRASDPWVTIAADGTPHQIGFAFNNTSAREAMLAVRSTDGGRTWTEPVFLTEESDPDVALDKESITADPSDANFVYAVWDRLTGASPGATIQTGPAWFTRTTDAGATWAPPKIIYDPGQNAQTIGNQIVVLPDGTLVNLMTVITQINQQSSPASLAVVRSGDRGVTWSQPIKIADVQSLGVEDPKDHKRVRTGDIVPAIAVDRASGALYVAWEDSRFTANARDGIALARSGDGGLHWDAPVRVNGAPEFQAFTPAVAVTQGKVGVTYYDLRNDTAADAPQLLTTAWLAVSTDSGKTFSESALGGPFDLRSAALTSEGWFIGDYQGLVGSGADFLAFLAFANDGNGGNPSDIYARPPGAPVQTVSVSAAPVTLAPRVRTGLRRAF